ncbi:heme-dependent oxidative N-demethylase subunit alpha family protein [Anthocerotibacter panamensis]|uniref:heme-dependent oxidative N-demethylase subunit alpha family protein n=1 Tax=Anthocerotibacter panamensis TaxID=2857077 RepID=UPI001C4075D7|nr:DUF3445 domain-containing protein [Anthocerotibacter panamensis]
MLPAPARYFPIATGRYEVTPGLIPLNTAFGNGAADGRVFQIDTNFELYRAAKLAARAESLSKYHLTQGYDPAVDQEVTRFLIEQLVLEYPEQFLITPPSPVQGVRMMYCMLTGEVLGFDEQMNLLKAMGSEVSPPYGSALDALACQIQEDLAVVSTGPDDQNWVSALHLCFPNHWSAEQKIGQDFRTVHEPVPGMTKINRAQTRLVEVLVQRGPAVRFSWGVGTDCRLNHHPVPPPDIPLDVWQGRSFNPAQPGLFLRVERQVLWGLPRVHAFVFTIRTYFTDVHAIRQDPEQRTQLGSALRSMTPDSLQYKGLAGMREEILDWLEV